jgi:hypothetical protein
MNAIGRLMGFAAKATPRVIRGIGEAVKVGRAIGQGARQVRNIGTALNSATGNKLRNNPLYNKALGVTERVENVSNQVADGAIKFGTELKNMGY